MPDIHRITYKLQMHSYNIEYLLHSRCCSYIKHKYTYVFNLVPTTSR